VPPVVVVFVVTPLNKDKNSTTAVGSDRIGGAGVVVVGARVVVVVGANVVGTGVVVGGVALMITYQGTAG